MLHTRLKHKWLSGLTAIVDNVYNDGEIIQIRVGNGIKFILKARLQDYWDVTTSRRKKAQPALPTIVQCPVCQQYWFTPLLSDGRSCNRATCTQSSKREPVIVTNPDADVIAAAITSLISTVSLGC